MRATFVRGILFLVPVVVLAIIVTKLFQISLIVAKPIDAVIPVQSVVGVAFANILAVLLIVVICFLAGVLVSRGGLARKVDKLDGALTDVIPGYAVVKETITTVAKDEESATLVTPVLVRFDDYEQVAFEIERSESKAVVFLPGSPSAWSGSSVVVDVDRVQVLPISLQDAIKLLRVMGRGTLGSVEQQILASQPASKS